MGEKKRAGIYLRLSREDDAEKEESNSISNQRLLTRDFAKLHQITVVDEYVDDGYSGTSFNRPGWKRLIDDAMKGEIDCIIVKDLSRMGRNNIECGKYLEQVFPRINIRFIAICDMYDSEKDNDPGASLTLAFKNLMNDFYCRDISEKVRGFFQTKMKMGEFIGNFPPYGFKRDEADKHHLLVDEDEAEIVREIFQLKIGGMNGRRIAECLENRGILSPAVKRGLSENTPWSVDIVNGILTNELYLGTMVQGKTKKLSYKSPITVKIPAEEWIRVENTHDPVIGRNTFDFVQELMGMDTTTPDGETHLNILSGFLRCGKCGQIMTRYKSSGYGNYRCSEYLRDNLKCKPNCCSERRMIKYVTIAVQRQAEKLRRILPLVETGEVIPQRKKQLLAIDEEIQTNIDLIAKYKCRQGDLYRHMMENIFTPSEYVMMNQKYQDKINEADKNILKLRDKKQKLIDGIAYLLPWLKSVKGFGNFTKLNRTILVTLIHYVDVVDPFTIHVKFRFAEDIDEILEQVNYEEKPVTRKIVMSALKEVPTTVSLIRVPMTV